MHKTTTPRSLSALDTIPVFELDYDLPPAERWEMLPKRQRNRGRKLMEKVLEMTPNSLVAGASGKILRLTTMARNPFRAEIEGAARVLGAGFDDALVTNFIIEFTTIGLYTGSLAQKSADSFAEGLSGIFENLRGWSRACTAGVMHSDHLGMLHLRALDWPLPGIGETTILLHHVNTQGGDYYSVGWPGYCGVLSGFKPGAFSASINQTFLFGRPSLQWPPSHLLRRVFDECETYDEALDALSHSSVCVPAMILLSSADRAAAVEMTPKGNRVHPMENGRPIAVANDYLSADWREKFRATYPGFATYLEGQTESVDPAEPAVDMDDRRNALLERMNRRNPRTPAQAFKILQNAPVEYNLTMQQMVYSHEKDELLIVGREYEKPVCALQL
jgi:hypothetical protein